MEKILERSRPAHHPPRTDDHPGDGATRSTHRMEAFADAVLAIAFTLPVVELHVPEAGRPLGEELARLWPSYLGFGIAAGVIGINWVHHHFSGAIYRTTGHWFNLATLLFLMAVSFIAFPARVLAENFQHQEHFPAAAFFFTAALAATTVTWSLKWTVGRVMGHVDDRLDPTYVSRLNAIYLGTAAVTVIAAVVSLWLPVSGLAIGALALLWYVLPPTTPVYPAEAPVVEGEA